MLDSRWLHQFHDHLSSIQNQTTSATPALARAQTNELQIQRQHLPLMEDLESTPWWYEEVQAMSLEDKSVREIRDLIVRRMGLFWINENDVMNMLQNLESKTRALGSPQPDSNLQLNPISKQRQMRQEAEIKAKDLPSIKILETRRKLPKMVARRNTFDLPRRSRRIQNVLRDKT
jgi:hypothetical protein